MPAVPTPQVEAARDPVFFFSIVEFQVDGVLFGLPNYVCEKSESFRAKVTTQKPCVLQDTTVAEFRDFLQCLIAPSSSPSIEGTGNPTTDDSEARAAYMRQWMNALKLATHWGFEDLRCKAIREIRRMDDPPLKFAVACKYDVPQFLPDALRDLADTNVMTPLNKEDYEILGFDLAIQVVQFREGCNVNAATEGKGSGDSEDDRHQRVIENVFGAEFAKDVKRAEDDLRPKLCACPVPPGRLRARRR